MVNSVALQRINKTRAGTETTHASQPPKLHIVFVHGLGGNANGTWTSKQGYWPQWVADEHPLAHVWVASYPAEIGHLIEGASPQPATPAIAKSLAECLWSTLQTPDNKAPILFVCHSLGGLVVKRVLVDSFQQIG